MPPLVQAQFWRSPRGFAGCLAFLLALPLAALSEATLGGGAAVIHLALALGSALMSLAVFDFKAPKWATWAGSVSIGILAVVFFLQCAAELAHDDSLTHLAYRVIGQRVERGLGDLFMAWCVVVLIADPHVSRRPGGFAMAAAWCVTAYGYGLAYQGASLDAQAPMLKLLWLAPFAWLAFESRRPLGTRLA